jgi:hypothetical protein
LNSARNNPLAGIAFKEPVTVEFPLKLGVVNAPVSLHVPVVLAGILKVMVVYSTIVPTPSWLLHGPPGVVSIPAGPACMQLPEVSAESVTLVWKAGAGVVAPIVPGAAQVLPNNVVALIVPVPDVPRLPPVPITSAFVFVPAVMAEKDSDPLPPRIAHPSVPQV